MMVITVFGILLGLIILGVPIAVSLALTAAGIMFYMGGIDLLIMLSQRMYASTTSFPLLAIPFFILAGNLMNTGGMTYRIFDFAQLFVGRIHGGLGHVNVIASIIFAGMSGSAVADAAGLGVVEIKAMEKAGYPKSFAATITAVSSTIGPIIPPSIPFVIYGSLSNVSVGALFLAGIVPGLLMGLSLMMIITIESFRRELPRSDSHPNLLESLKIFVNAFPAVITPVIIIGGILGGIFTPTEAAVVASIYAAILGLFFYRELHFKDLPAIIWDTGVQTVQVLIIISGAGAFGWILIQQQIPNAVIDILLSFTQTPWVILLIINIILFILGMFIEAVAIMIIVFPIFLPLVMQIGVSPIHFGVIMVLNLMIGLVTPPVGLCLFGVSGVSKVPIKDLINEIWPYIIALIAVLLIVTYVPEISMSVPRLFGIA